MASDRFVRFFGYLNWITLKKTLVRAFKGRLIGLSAEIAYNATLALFPAIIAVFTAIGLLADSIKNRLAELAITLYEIVPKEVWTLILDFVQGIKLTNSSWFSLSFVAAIWIASGALSATMNALDRIEKVPNNKRRPFWKAKLISIFLTIGTILLLIIASFLVLIGDLIIQLAVEQNWRLVMVNIWQLLSGPVILGIITTAAAMIYQIIQVSSHRQGILGKIKWILFIVALAGILLFSINLFLMFIGSLIEKPDIDRQVGAVLLRIWQLLSWPVALGIVATNFAAIYRFGPSLWIKGTPILPGAILAAISWAVLSALFRYYVSNFGHYNKIYGAVGTGIILLFWLRITALVILLGYQLNMTVGEAMKPKKAKKNSIHD
jgi:membrane protein